MTESLLEAYWYLTSQKSLWNKDSLNEIYRDFVDESVYQAGIDTAYQGPNLDNGCSVSHVVMVTDGEPTWDWAGNNYIRGLTGAGAPTVVTPFNEADRTSDETLLDELADYMANTDLDTSKPGKQTVVTHFVSTWSEPEYRKILDVAVQKSGGLHVALDNIEELPEALAEIVSNLNGAPSNFRVYQTQLVQSENTPFESQDTAFVIESRFNQGIWSGVLKRFNSDAQGVVSDKNGVLLVDPTTNQVNQEAIDVWSSDPVAGSGQAPIGTRRYTLLQDQTTGAFLNAGNQLHQAQQQAILERLTGSAAVKQTTFNWLTGVDVQDVDSDGDATEVRSAFGDQINQKPEVVFTGRDDMTVYFGDNQGFLNAVDGKTGRHLYSFMPPEFLAKVNDLAGITTAQGKRYGIDGALKSFTLIDPNRRTRARKRNFLAFSFGKGGSGVYILDVTERDNPKLALRISAATPGFENMGEAWATPEVSYAETPDGKVPVALFGGGFSADNAKGGSVYVVNLDKSKLLWTVDQQFSQTLDQHRFPIVNKVTKLDSNQDGMTNAFFYNDVRGNIFRCDFNAKDANNALQCGQLASAQRNNEALSFYSPLDVALMKAGPGQPKLVLTQSSGDRLNPNSLTERDRLMVAIIDKPFTAPAALYDGSVEPIQGANLPELTAGTDQATLGGGWRFSFPNEGEKGFGKTLIFNNQLFLSTYQAGVLVAQPVALPAAKSTTVRPTRTSTAPTSAAATAPAATSATGPSASSRPAPPPRGASGRPVPPTNPLPSGSSVSITTSGSTSASGGTTGTSNSTSGAGSRVRECGTATTQGIARIYGFNLTSPTQGVGAQAAGAAQWVGPVRNLPDMPSVIRDDNSDMPVARINLGIDTTSIEVQYEPLQRQYWYEKPY